MDRSENNKPTVQYIITPNNLISVGKPAYVRTIDHPSPLVTNNEVVRTSNVISYHRDKDEESFETLNTKYVGVNS